MKPRINMITLGVKDMEESIRFYEDWFGSPRMPFDGTAVFFDLNGSWLSLYPWKDLAQDAEVPEEGQGFRGVTLAHNVSSKSEVDNLMARAQKAGATIKRSAQDVFWGGYSGYFSDPNGHLWEVAWNPHFWPGPKDE